MPPATRPVALWLLLVAVLVFVMVLVGGATRLTRSGLSIVEWRPVTGVLPPLGEAAWQAEFEKYRQFPEYRKVNRGMSLDEFKEIFWFEYAHRLLGRLIGVAFLLPFLWFLWRRQVPRALVPGLFGLFLLGGLQGFVGWWMVASGLVDRPDVSHYRLTVHLGMAFGLYAALLWLGLRLLRAPAASPATARIGRWTGGFAMLLYLQILLGALVAGLDAGLIYNTFPTMNGAWLPAEATAMVPAWVNSFENHAMVQFQHRMGAYLVLAVALLLWWRGRPRLAGRARLALDLVLATTLLQAGLGVVTLLAGVPVWLGVLHQGGALLVLSAAVLLLHETLPVRAAAAAGRAPGVARAGGTAP